MFVGMIASMTVLLFGTLWEHRGNLALNTAGRMGKWGTYLTSLSIIAILITIVYAPALHKIGIFVPIICIEYNKVLEESNIKQIN